MVSAPPPGPQVPATGILRPDETAAVANLRRDLAVSAPLAPFVERYWSVRWDRTGLPAHRAEVLSDPSVNVSVESGTHPRFGFELPAVLVHAVVTRRFTVDLVGAGRVTAVKFRPGGFTAFTGTRPERDVVTRLDRELGVAPEALASAVAAADDDVGRAAAVDAVLAPLAPEPPRPYLELLAVLGRMREDRTLVRVEDVAAEAGMAVRTLQRLFARYVGVGPKAVLARHRVQHAVAAIDAGEGEDLAALAASLGWYDQAHFSREFGAVVGTTPSQYLRGAAGRLSGRRTGRRTGQRVARS